MFVCWYLSLRTASIFGRCSLTAIETSVLSSNGAEGSANGCMPSQFDVRIVRES